MRRLVWLLVVLVMGLTRPVWAQLSPPNELGVSMGHLHYYVRDVDANTRFWVALGGIATSLDTTTVVKFRDVLVFLSLGESSGGTEGSVVNHMAFRVQSLDTIEAAGFEFERSGSGVTSVYTPRINNTNAPLMPGRIIAQIASIPQTKRYPLPE